MNVTPARHRVLHLVDRVTGGVPVAVRSYIAHSPDRYEHVIASPFQDGCPASVWTGLEVAHVDWDTRSPARALAHARRLLRGEHHDVIHAHSSFPGVYARLLCSPRTTHVVYTPHCFAFLRQDVPGAVRVAYRLAERILASRTSVLAACGPGESIEAEKLGLPRKRIVEVPNVSSLLAVPREASSRIPAKSDRIRVGMLGRWAPQKDPVFFRDRIEALRRELPGIRVEGWWIGGSGDPTAGSGPDGLVHRTGWLTPLEVGDRLRDLDVYLHSAAWEGFPIALLDARAAGLPMLCRSISAVPGLPPELSVERGWDGFVTAVRGGRLLEWGRANRATWDAYLGDRTARAQRSALNRAWTARGVTPSRLGLPR